MQITGNSLLSSSLLRGMTDLRQTFDTLNTQLSTGKVAQTYGGLGDTRTVSLAMRANIAKMTGYQDTITNVNLRLSGATAALQQINTLGQNQRNDTVVSNTSVVATSTDASGAVVGQTQVQLAARSRLNDALSALNTDVAGSYLFSGADTGTQPVADADTILGGSPGKAGLTAVIEERRRADVGHVATVASPATAGRLTLTTTPGSGGAGDTVTLSKDAGVFGFGLGAGAVSSTLVGPSVTQSASAPYAVAITDTGTQPLTGQVVTLTLGLPDGTSTQVSLAATASAAGSGQFQIGASSADTLTNLKAALGNALGNAAQSTLTAASAMRASGDFFAAGQSTAPVRVDLGSPAGAPEDATATKSDATGTLVWYKGQDSVSATSPYAKDGAASRASMTAQIDQSIKVGYGVQANETGIARTVAALAVMASTTFPKSATDPASSALKDPNALALNDAMISRVREALQPNAGANSVVGITTQLAGAAEQATAVKTRLTAATNVAQDAIDSVESADPTAVYAAISDVQTRLQASYQTTAMLSKLSLVNYLN